jgi:ketosteroid isomerase-like protein
MNELATDQTEITALIHAYASLIDGGDLDGVAALFEHATWRSPGAGIELQGTDEVRKIYSRVHLYDGSPHTKHLISNLTVDVDPGGQTAAAECYYTVIQGIVPGEPIGVILSGRYQDQFEKANGRWRFTDRLFIVDLIGDQSRHFG